MKNGPQLYFNKRLVKSVYVYFGLNDFGEAESAYFPGENERFSEIMISANKNSIRAIYYDLKGEPEAEKIWYNPKEIQCIWGRKDVKN